MKVLKQSVPMGCATAVVFVIIALFLDGCASEPGLVLSGTVTDAVTGEPIAGARVSDDGYGPKPYRGAVTDATGRYQYKTWCEEHNVVARAPGYRPQREAMFTSLFQTEKEKVMDFELSPEQATDRGQADGASPRSDSP